MKKRKVFHILIFTALPFILVNCFNKTITVNMFEHYSLSDKEVGIIYVIPSIIFQREVEIQLYVDGKNSDCGAKRRSRWRFVLCKIRVLEGAHHLFVHIPKHNLFFEFENIFIEKGKEYNLGFSSLGQTEIMCTLLDTSDSRFWTGVPRKGDLNYET